MVSTGEHDGIRITYELAPSSGGGRESTLTVTNGSAHSLTTYDITVYVGAADGRTVLVETARSGPTTKPLPPGKTDISTTRSDNSIFPRDWPQSGEVWASYKGTGGAFETEHVRYPPTKP